MKITSVKACTGCGAPLSRLFADLGHMPPANSLVPMTALHEPETHLPLRVGVCETCFLVQLIDRVDPGEVFSNYPYFSSVSSHWLAHSEAFAADMATSHGIGPGKFVVELASNDGYLLQYVKKAGARCLGVEPAANVAEVAVKRGVPTLVAFFGAETARRVKAEHGAADLVVANNVLAHVPELQDFVAGIADLLSPSGMASIEFPHLANLIAETQFDTIYHEHFFYYSLLALKPLFARHGLTIVDVKELPTHGGSLRVFLKQAAGHPTVDGRVDTLLSKERTAGLDRIETYDRFQTEVIRVAHDLAAFLLAEAKAGRWVAGYGAAAKGATLLNVAGIRPHLLPYVCDASPHKQGHLMPGCRIPVLAPDEILRRKPQTVLILPWNIKAEVAQQLSGIKAWGGRFATAVPRMEFL